MAVTLGEYNTFCKALPATSHVVQWGGAHVWKVGGPTGKVFAVAWFEQGHEPGITFKVSDIGWEVLRDAPGCRPAPYFASRGMKWIQSFDQPGLSKSELKKYLRASHLLAAAGLPLKRRKELGLS
jgi:predicted DNA-binding protein (MmcQ/YjbR family)